jgi:hypothetical protein
VEMREGIWIWMDESTAPRICDEPRSLTRHPSPYPHPHPHPHPLSRSDGPVIVGPVGASPASSQPSRGESRYRQRSRGTNSPTSKAREQRPGGFESYRRGERNTSPTNGSSRCPPRRPGWHLLICRSWVRR